MHHRAARPAALLLSILTTATTPQAAVRYVLESESAFQQGCVPPCMCPVLIRAPLEGTFDLSLISVGDVFDFYAVEEVRWTTGEPAPHRISGRGTYKVSTLIDQQGMTLDLSIDQNLPVRFVSGEVATSVAFPDIVVTVAEDGTVCNGTWMDLRVRPTPRLAVEPGTLVWDSGLEVAGYDVVRGKLSVLKATKGDFALALDACLANNLGDHRIPFLAVPPPDDGFFVLVRAGASTYDTLVPSQARSRDPEIAASPVACP